MKNFPLPLILLLCAVLVSGGCADIGAVIVTGLRIEVTKIERTSDGTVSATWRLLNPNVTPYLLSRITSKIYLNGTLVGTIADHEPLGIPPRDSATRSGRLVLANPAADRVLIEAAAHGPAGYRVDSALVVQIYGDQKEKADITSSGTVAVISK